MSWRFFTHFIYVFIYLFIYLFIYFDQPPIDGEELDTSGGMPARPSSPDNENPPMFLAEHQKHQDVYFYFIFVFVFPLFVFPLRFSFSCMHSRVHLLVR